MLDVDAVLDAVRSLLTAIEDGHDPESGAHDNIKTPALFDALDSSGETG